MPRANFLGGALVTAIAPTVLDQVLSRVLPSTGARTPMTQDDIREQIRREFEDEFARRVKTDPVVRNELNAEAPHQSRVVLGTSTSIIGAVAILLPIVLGLFGIDVSTDRIVEIVGAVMTLSGAAYALYGRLASGLKPLFSRG